MLTHHYSASCHCVRMLEEFLHEDTFCCVVLEALGPSLDDYNKQNDYCAYWMQDIQVIARQTLEAIVFLHRHDIIYNDLKPSNICFLRSDGDILSASPRSEWRAHLKRAPIQSREFYRKADSSIKIIDFGSAITMQEREEYRGARLCSLNYLPPELCLDSAHLVDNPVD
eukprot:1556319-Karenia_brevis.AAC.1